MDTPGAGAAPHRDRTRARAWILQVFYRWEAVGRGSSMQDALADTARTRSISSSRLPYVARVVEAFDGNARDVDARLERALDNWTLERLSRVDRSILRLAATEILFIEDVPPPVSIQEAVRLAQRYGGEDSARFVNGVLDALFKGTEPPGTGS